MKVTSKTVFAIISLLSFVTLEACGTVQKLAGRDKNPPDEFAVVKRPELIMPPEYNLSPPSPGEINPHELAASTETLRALFPDNPNITPQISKGEAALLRSIEAQSLSDVRSELTDPDSGIVEKGTVLEDIVGIEERSGAPDGSSISHLSSEPVNEGGGL